MLHFIVAIENDILRNAILSALAPLNCLLETIPPDTLLLTELSGDNLIFIETSNDTERLVDTIQQVWSTWGKSQRAFVHFLSYSTEDVTPDSLVFRLWSIGPEMTVIVQTWNPDNLTEWQKYAYRAARLYLETWQADTVENAEKSD